MTLRLYKTIVESKDVRFYSHSTCPHCKGSGGTKKIDGQKLRIIRQQCQVSLRDLAKHINLSAAYVSDVELGRRNLPEHRLQEWVNALSELSKGYLP